MVTVQEYHTYTVYILNQAALIHNPLIFWWSPKLQADQNGLGPLPPKILGI